MRFYCCWTRATFALSALFTSILSLYLLPLFFHSIYRANTKPINVTYFKIAHRFFVVIKRSEKHRRKKKTQQFLLGSNVFKLSFISLNAIVSMSFVPFTFSLGSNQRRLIDSHTPIIEKIMKNEIWIRYWLIYDFRLCLAVNFSSYLWNFVSMFDRTIVRKSFSFNLFQ